MREFVIRLADKVLDSWYARRTIGESGVRLVRAMRTFWHRAATDDLERLVGYYEAEPVCREAGGWDQVGGVYECIEKGHDHDRGGLLTATLQRVGEAGTLGIVRVAG